MPLTDKDVEVGNVYRTVACEEATFVPGAIVRVLSSEPAYNHKYVYFVELLLGEVSEQGQGYPGGTPGTWRVWAYELHELEELNNADTIPVQHE